MKYSAPLKKISERMRNSIGETTPMAVRQLYSEVEMMTRQIAAIENMAANPSPHMTEDGHYTMVAREKDRLEKQLNKTLDRINAKFGESYISISDQRDKILGLKEDQFAQEYRTAFRNMTQEQKTTALTKAIKKQESSVIAALTKAPAMLSGLDENVQDRTLTQYYDQYAPQLTKQISELEAAASTSLIALRNARTAVKDGIDPKKLQDIQSREIAHQEAQKELSSIGPNSA